MASSSSTSTGYDAPSASPASTSDSPSTASSKSPKTAPESSDNSDEKMTDEYEFALHHAARNEKPRLTIDRYIARHTVPVDQLAGFSRYALDCHEGTHTVAEWDKFYEAYKTSPVR